MFFIKLKESYDQLTYSEIRVSNYLLSNKNHLDIMTGEELSKKVGVSQSTITRFSQKLGYTSIRSLLDDFLHEQAFTEDDFEISSSETTSQTSEKVSKAYHNAIDSTLSEISAADLDHAVSMLINASRIACFGVYHSLLMAKYFSTKLQEIGLDSVCDDDLYYMGSVIQNMKPNDVVFIISQSGKSRLALRIAEIAQKYSIPIIAVTGKRSGALRGMASLVLHTSTFDIATGLSATAIKCSQLYMLDTLYLNIYKRNYTLHDQKALDMYENFSFEIGKN